MNKRRDEAHVNKIVVKLSPLQKSVKGAMRLGGVKISIFAGGKGPSKVDLTSKKKAVLELFEASGKGDSVTTERLIYSIAGTLFEDKKIAKFDSGTNAPLQPIKRSDSDFFLDHEFEKASCVVPNPGDFLRFQWETEGEGKFMEVRARLTGTDSKGTLVVESDFADNDKLDVVLKHADVPDDGTDAKDPTDCIGIGTVYPTRHRTVCFNKRVPFVGQQLRVFLDEEFGKRVEALKPGSFSLPALRKHLESIFLDAGFGAPVLKEIKFADPASAAIWEMSPPPTAEVVAHGSGVDIPFFDYWIFVDEFSPPPKGEIMHSETYAVGGVDPKKITKKALTPIGAFTKNTSAFASVLKKTPSADVPKVLAVEIAHEIGHGLGLRHALEFDHTTGGYTLAVRMGVMSTVDDSLTPRAVQLFGPVHKRFFKDFYL
jgi:hypothetical protein